MIVIISFYMKQFIVMADIIGSRGRSPDSLMADFKSLVTVVNRRLRKRLLSPLTITLGDEFQGVAVDLESACTVLLELEAERVRKGFDFGLRYVIHFGDIGTPLNRRSAHGMLGPGLTDARAMLSEARSGKLRFRVSVGRRGEGRILEDAFLILADLVDAWDPVRDFPLAAAFMRDPDYKSVALALGKNRSLTWKRRRSLRMDDYFRLRRIISTCAQSAGRH
jgi:hypothetical protein